MPEGEPMTGVKANPDAEKRWADFWERECAKDWTVGVDGLYRPAAPRACLHLATHPGRRAIQR